MTFFVYILYSPQFNKYYIGQTNEVDQRIKRHNSGQVSATAPYIPWDIVLIVKKDSRSEAVLLERKLKNLNRDRLLQFISKYGR